MHIMSVESEHLFVTTAHKNIFIANIQVNSTVMNCTSNLPAFVCVYESSTHDLDNELR